MKTEILLILLLVMIGIIVMYAVKKGLPVELTFFGQQVRINYV